MATGLAVVGLGARGREWVREVQAHAGFELTAAVDLDPAARAAARRRFALAPTRVFTTLEEALREPGRTSAVLVATPAQDHPAACRQALDAGLAVLVEKPFTLDLAAANSLVRLAAAKRVPLIVAQSYRELRVHRAARRVIREGRLGAIRLVTCQHFRSEPDAPDPGRLATLWDLGSHHLDAIRDLLSAEPIEVLARIFDDGRSVEVLLGFPQGVRATYLATQRSRGHELFEGGKEHYMRVVGERGTLHVIHRWLMLCESGRLPRPVRRGPRGATEEARLLDQLAAEIAGARPSGISGRENIGTMAILDACERSATERTWVRPRLEGQLDG